jgi:hypothetical protein
MSIEHGGHSPEQHQAEEELENFKGDWETPDNEKLFAKVVSKIKKSGDILGEIRTLANKLTDTLGDEEETNLVLESYLKGNSPEQDDEEEEGASEWEMGTDEEL